MSAKFYQRQVSVSTGNKFNTKFYIVNPGELCIERVGLSALEWAKSGVVLLELMLHSMLIKLIV